ncbi:MAG: hypothetical protein M3457_12655 [Chloroflexota bacterium]|nr:hypothetical protein [Chloroflexota bacterium]
MTAPAIGRATGRRNNLLMLASLVIAIVASFAPGPGQSAAAQPLCLDGKVWSEEAQSCVDLAEAQPVEDLPLQEPQPAEIPVPTEVIVPTDISVEDEETPPTDQPAPTDVSDGTETPGGDSDLRSGGLSSLYMFQRACPVGFDPRTADQATLWATCGGFSGEVVYSLTVDGKVFGSAMSPAMPAMFSDVPPGDFTVSQSAPPGYTGPAVLSCYEYGYSIPHPSTVRMLFPDGVDGGSFVLQDVQPNTPWWCDSYLVPITTGGITAYVFECPAGIDMYTSEPEDLKANCDPYLENVQFELEYSDLVSASSTNTLGRTTYKDVPPGAYRLRERMPNNYGVPVVFCTVTGPSGQTLENYDRFDVSNTASIGLGMDALENVACDFFMAPSGQAYEDPGFPPQGLVPGDNGTPVVGEPSLQDPGFPVQGPGGTPLAEQPEQPAIPEDEQATDPLAEDLPLDIIAEEGGEGGPESAALIEGGNIGLHIYTYQCPDNFAAYTSDYALLASTCTQNTPGLTFSIQVNGGVVATLTTAGSPAYIFSPDLPAGDMTIQESVPLGFGDPIVYCYVVREGQVIREWGRYPVSVNSVQVPGLTSPDITYCGWFNVPTHDNGAIDVVAWSCPAGYDIYTKGPDELIGDCGQKLDGVEFQLQHPANGISSQMTAGLRSTAYFRGITPGQVTLREIMPNKYGIPVVFCEATGPQGQTIDQYDRYNVSNSASVQLGMDELDHFRCDFFQAQVGVLPVDNADDLSNQEISIEQAGPEETQVPDGSPLDDLLPVDPFGDESGEEPMPATPPALPPS